MTTIEESVAEDSDYGDFGSDAEELEILEQLLVQAENPIPATVDIEEYERPQRIRLPKILGFEARDSSQAQIDIEVLREVEIVESRKRVQPSQEPAPPVPDDRSPLERFRRPPKKALSVTDLVSPAWCELQYFYTLTKHGRKRRTVAMKKGSAVHQALEDEVHTTVPVEVSKKEDSWGLRIWNIIQGLRTLRETGRTRELEIWGTVGGEIVNGIIDELSYECPDPKYEENERNNRDSTIDLPEYQTSITDYLLAGAKTEAEEGQPVEAAMLPPSQKQRKEGQKWIYITDVKTRATPTLPSGSSIRPTILQLHLYHHMLENLVQGNFQLSQLAQRYDLDVNETFSDSFLAQLGSLNQDLFEASSSQEDQLRASQIMSSQDSMEILLQHNNLADLWDFMMSQFRKTFFAQTDADADAGADNSNNNNNEPPTPTPQSVSDLPTPSDQPTLLSPFLTAEYLAPTYKHVAGRAKRAIGRKSFGFNPTFLKSYLEDNLAWWRGEREAKGVELQEAWKCRSCDFREDCQWIHERDDAALKEALDRKKMREIAGVDGEKKNKGLSLNQNQNQNQNQNSRSKV